MSGGRTRAVAHTRSLSSINLVLMLAWLSQMVSGPQEGEGAIGAVFEDGVFGSRTGCFSWLAVCVFGSSTGKRSVLSSGAPYSLPLALMVGLRRSVEIKSCI